MNEIEFLVTLGGLIFAFWLGMKRERANNKV